MLKFTNKHLQVTLVTLLNITLSTHCSEKPWYNFIISEGRLYKMSVSAINVATGIRTIINKPIMAINPDKFIKVQKNKLTLMEKNIRTKEKNAIRTIVKENGLNKNHATSLLKRINTIHESRKKHLSKSHPNITHDHNLDPKLVEITTNQLQKAGMDINSVHLIQSDTPSPMGVIASSTPPSYSILVKNGTISVSHNSKKHACIIFFPKFYSYSKKSQEAICIHEATHIVEGHGNTKQDIVFFINFYNKKTYDDLKKEQSFQNMQQIHEAQAEVLPSLQDTKSATLMRAFRSDDYYPDMLYGQHYLELTNIDETHKMITYLERIKNNPRKPMPPIKEIRLRQFTQNNL